MGNLIVTFVVGLTLGVVYEKTFRRWKDKAAKVAHAAVEAAK